VVSVPEAVDDVHRLVEEWEAHHVPFAYRIYRGVGHSFLRLSELEPGRETSAAALDAWAKAMDFFEENLPVEAR
jgi:dienelactone hydrolase